MARSPKILLVNPPVYDFTAYDFWLKPYGLLKVAGALRGKARLELFDFLDRLHPAVAAAPRKKLRRDAWGRGEYPHCEIPRPAAFSDIPRRYNRFGLEQDVFTDWLSRHKPFDFALVQTGMTYWYGGVREVIEDIRRISPDTKIVLGGVYATLCADHARGLGADLVIEGEKLDPLWSLLPVAGDMAAPPLWEGYDRLETAVMKLTEGCPFRCTYCAAWRMAPRFSTRPVATVLDELRHLRKRGARNIAFYDDALLWQSETALEPFCCEAIRQGLTEGISFHTPNALHAKWLTPTLARQMVRAGFESFYLGLESCSEGWHQRAGGGSKAAKVSTDQFACAVEALRSAGAAPENITAYLILGHPNSAGQDLERSMQFACDLGVRIMLAEFSPVPGTPDGQACRTLVDLNEPLNHNKTAFAIRALGGGEVNRLKQLARNLNDSLPQTGS